MNPILSTSVLACLSLALTSPSFAKTTQLPTQTIDVQPTHLTTRIEWKKLPRPAYSNADLNGQDRSAVVRVYADEQGQIKQANIQDSTGYKKLDQILLDAVKKAEIRPHVVNQTTAPVIGYQVFQLKLQDEGSAYCEYSFNSKNWHAQQKQEKTKFQYLTQPTLSIDSDLLKDHDREVKFKIKTNRHGVVKKMKIKQGSGVYAIDQQIVQAVKGAQLQRKRMASTLWLYKPSSFKDEIQFEMNNCK